MTLYLYNSGTIYPILVRFYFTAQGMVKYCNLAWKKWFFASFFSKYLKNGWNYFDLKNWTKPLPFGLQKALISKHRKNNIFRDINYFLKMSVSTLVCYQIFVDTLTQKLLWISKRNFTFSFGALRSRAD